MVSFQDFANAIQGHGAPSHQQLQSLVNGYSPFGALGSPGPKHMQMVDPASAAARAASTYGYSGPPVQIGGQYSMGPTLTPAQKQALSGPGMIAGNVVGSLNQAPGSGQMIPGSGNGLPGQSIPGQSAPGGLPVPPAVPPSYPGASTPTPPFFPNAFPNVNPADLQALLAHLGIGGGASGPPALPPGSVQIGPGNQGQYNAPMPPQYGGGSFGQPVSGGSPFANLEAILRQHAARQQPQNSLAEYQAGYNAPASYFNQR